MIVYSWPVQTWMACVKLIYFKFDLTQIICFKYHRSVSILIDDWFCIISKLPWNKWVFMLLFMHISSVTSHSDVQYVESLWTILTISKVQIIERFCTCDYVLYILHFVFRVWIVLDFKCHFGESLTVTMCTFIILFDTNTLLKNLTP